MVSKETHDKYYNKYLLISMARYYVIYCFAGLDVLSDIVHDIISMFYNGTD